ncbi:MAG: hypothetical protein ACYDAY_08990 [Candidatus Dormibacteria bacterium]
MDSRLHLIRRLRLAVPLAVALFWLVSAVMASANQMTVTGPDGSAGSNEIVTASNIADSLGNPSNNQNVQFRISDPSGATTTLVSKSSNGSASVTYPGQSTHVAGTYGVIATTGQAAANGTFNILAGPANGVYNPTFGNCAEAAGNPITITCTPATNLPGGALVGYTITNVADVYGNLETTGSVAFALFQVDKNGNHFNTMNSTGTIVPKYDTSTPPKLIGNSVLVPTTGTCSPAPCTPPTVNNPVTSQDANGNPAPMPCTALGNTWYTDVTFAGAPKAHGTNTFGIIIGQQVRGNLTSSNIEVDGHGNPILDANGHTIPTNVVAGSALSAAVQWTDRCGNPTGDGTSTFSLQRLDKVQTGVDVNNNPVYAAQWVQKAQLTQPFTDGTPDSDDTVPNTPGLLDGVCDPTGTVCTPPTGSTTNNEPNSHATSTVLIEDGTGYNPVLADAGSWRIIATSSYNYPNPSTQPSPPCADLVNACSVTANGFDGSYTDPFTLTSAALTQCVASASPASVPEQANVPAAQYPTWTATFKDRFGNLGSNGVTVDMLSTDPKGGLYNTSRGVENFNGQFNNPAGAVPTALVSGVDAFGQPTGGTASIAINYAAAAAAVPPVAAPVPNTPAGTWTSFWGNRGLTATNGALCNNGWVVQSGLATGTFNLADTLANASGLTTVVAGSPTTLLASGIKDVNGDPVTQGLVTLTLTGPAGPNSTTVTFPAANPVPAPNVGPFGAATVTLPGGLLTKTGSYTVTGAIDGATSSAAAALNVIPGGAASNLCLTVPSPITAGTDVTIASDFCNGASALAGDKVSFIITLANNQTLPTQVATTDANGHATTTLSALDDTLAGVIQIDAFASHLDANNNTVNDGGGQAGDSIVAGPLYSAQVLVKKGTVLPSQAETLTIQGADKFGNAQALEVDTNKGTAANPNPNYNTRHLLVTGFDPNGIAIYRQELTANGVGGTIELNLSNPYTTELGTWTWTAFAPSYDHDLRTGTATYQVVTPLGPVPNPSIPPVPEPSLPPLPTLPTPPAVSPPPVGAPTPPPPPAPVCTDNPAPAGPTPICAPPS